MNHLPQIDMQAFGYELPEEYIAKYPLEDRAASRLLVWAEGTIAHHQFRELPELLQGDELLFFNNTKVIPARLFFQKHTGALIEVFLLQPVVPAVVDLAMQSTARCTWQCTIGNLKAWKDELVLERELVTDNQSIALQASIVDRSNMLVELRWTGDIALPALLELAGQMPIPPYLHRAAELSDRSNYQTVYSKKSGAVAAPTAGLHFTPEVLAAVKAKGVGMHELTLHVSAGTFMPVKVSNAIEHEMHFEQVVVQKAEIEALMSGKPVVATGTTSMRTLESLYWYGVKLLANPDAPFVVEKTDAYTLSGPSLPALPEAMAAVLAYMQQQGKEELHGNTQLFIMPGYQFRVVDTLITNFHQPGSTLLLLVAAFTGGTAWQDIYATAMKKGYRFLSYGDSSLLRRSPLHP